MPDSRYVALLRGINVGTAKRLGMADLRAVFEQLGFTNVRTLLQSGNVVFDSESRPVPSAVEASIAKVTGVSPRVLLLSASAFRSIVDANPLREVSVDHSKAVVTFVEAMPASIDRPAAADLEPEILEIGENALYQWLPDGTLATKIKPAFYKPLGLYTARNLRTVDKLVAMLDA